MVSATVFLVVHNPQAIGVALHGTGGAIAPLGGAMGSHNNGSNSVVVSGLTWQQGSRGGSSDDLVKEEKL